MTRRSPVSLRRVRAPANCLFVPAQLLRMFGLYRQSNNEAEFKYLHVFKRIDKCEKWAEVRRTLAKAKETYKPDAPMPGAADGRPDDNKGAKRRNTSSRLPHVCKSPSSTASPTPRPGPPCGKRKPRRGGRR